MTTAREDPVEDFWTESETPEPEPQPEPKEPFIFRRVLPPKMTQRLERIYAKFALYRDDDTKRLPDGDLPVLPEDVALAYLVVEGTMPRSEVEDPLYDHVRASLPPPPRASDKAMTKAYDGQIYVALRDEVKRWKATKDTAEQARFTLLSDFLAEPDETLEWVAYGLIPFDALIQFLGKLESFKSMAMQDLHIATTYGEKWLNLDIPPLHSYYVSGEKRRRSIRNRLRRLVEGQTAQTQKELTIIHRGGLRIDTANDQWLRLVDAVHQRKERCLVSLDTITTLAPSGFNENSGESWAVVLEAIRMLTDLPEPATVLGAFHPSKEDKGGVGMQSRGHTSFGGEADGALIFSRPNRMTNIGTIHARPKDGDYSAIPFYWDDLTFRIVPTDLTTQTLTNTSMVAVVAAKGPCEFEVIWDAYGYKEDGKHRFGEPKVRDVLNASIAGGDIYSDAKDHPTNVKTLYSIPEEAED